MTSEKKKPEPGHVGPDGQPCPFSKDAQDAISISLAELRMEQALECIQKAENLVAEALQQLDPIVGGVPLWSRGSKAHNALKDFWVATNKGRATMRSKDGPRVDDTHLLAELKRRAAKRAALNDAPNLAELEAAEAEGRQLAAELVR